MMISATANYKEELSIYSSSELLLRHRLKLIENLWESVLTSECGRELVDLLDKLKSACSPEGQTTEIREISVSKWIEQLELDDAIKAARAFALYFQLINIVEQHYEQRTQKLIRKTTTEDQVNAIQNLESGNNPTLETNDKVQSYFNPTVNPASGGTFHWLFPYLQKLNMPPQKIQQLLDQLDINLVFTAHPTEIVRHTIRKKQRRISFLLEKLDSAEESFRAMGLTNSWEAENYRERLMAEVRMWWRTDELHQFKPTVLDEVDYALHYFQEVLFDTLPELSTRLKQALHNTFPKLKPPTHKFCYFGSWTWFRRSYSLAIFSV